MNAELIKVLRCELYGDDECDKSDCQIWSELGCRNGIANRAAADALEAAEKRIATYQFDVADLEQREKELNDVLNERARLITELQARIAELEAEMKLKDKEFEKMASDATDFEADLHERIAELEAQLSKEGEWIDRGWNGDSAFLIDGRGNCWKEYECSECHVRSRGAKWNFCPNCGAKMKGANDDKN